MLTQLILIMTPLGRLYVCVFVVNMSIAMMEAGVPRQEGSKSRDLGLDYFDLLARSLARTTPRLPSGRGGANSANDPHRKIRVRSLVRCVVAPLASH
jgi:hypothetical protein